MSQIISIHVGGAGVKVGLDYWQQLTSYSNNLKDESSKFYSHRLYSETLKGEHIPKALFLDTDVRALNLVHRSPIKFDPTLSIGKGSSCFNLFSQGYYGSGCQVIDPFIQCVRKQVEKADMLSGFILMSSPTGGAGSGVGANVVCKLREYYCDRMVEDFRIFQGTDSENTYRNLDALQIYNTVLRAHYDISNTDMTYCLENNAVATILARKGKFHSTFGDVNKYLAKCLVEHVSWYVEPGTLNTNQRKRAVSMIPFPRMKNFCCSLSDQNSKNYLESALSHRNKLMYHESPVQNSMFSMNVNVRDNWTSQNEINRGVSAWMSNTSNCFRYWIPNGLQVSIGSIGRRSPRAWVLYNGRNNIDWLKKVCDLFTGQFRRKAFLYHYTSAGMDEMEFTEAESDCNDLISEYIPWGTYDEGEEENAQSDEG